MKIKKIFCTILLLICTPIFGQKGQFTGTLITANEKEIAFAKIEIIEVSKSFYADKKGFFLSPKIPFGTYTIKIEANGFLPFQKTYTLDAPEIRIAVNFQEDKTYSFEEIKVSRKKTNSFFLNFSSKSFYKAFR